MSEPIDNVEANEEATPSEETAQVEGQETETPEVEGEVAEPKADGAFVKTDNANVQARFNKITAKSKSETSRANAETSRADAAEAKLAQIEAEGRQSIINKAPPTEEQFDYNTEAFQTARDQHNQNVGLAIGQQQAAELLVQQRQVDAANQLNQAYSEKVVKFVEKTPDFVESVSALQGLNQQVMNHIQGLENGPQVAYELSKNMNLAQQLNNAANSGDAMSAGSILAQVQSTIKSAPKDKKITKAGSPIDSPIQGGVAPDNPDKQYKHISGAKFF